MSQFQFLGYFSVVPFLSLLDGDRAQSLKSPQNQNTYKHVMVVKRKQEQKLHIFLRGDVFEIC